MSWLLPVGMAAALFGLVVTVACMLAPRDARLTVLALVFFGLFASGLKILIFQQAPQWHDINPDSLTYDLNAKAFAAHWAGHSVDGARHHLRGLLAFNAAGLHGPEWHPGDPLTYAAVSGSHEWVYTAYAAIWYWLSGSAQGFVIGTNAIWAAFFPAAAFGIASSLGAIRRVAIAASVLALVDPSAGVNASWLLKDTLAGFLAMTSLWGLLGYLREGGRAQLLIASLALGALGGVRFVTFLGFVITSVLISIWLFSEKQRLQALVLAGVLSCGWLFQGVLSQAPQPTVNASLSLSAPNSAINIPTQVFVGGLNVLNASEGDHSADDSVIAWKTSLADAPAFAVLRSLARTLFAPYPWVAIDPGLNWKSFAELYYPGVLLWIACLPGVITALLLGLRGRDPVFWFLLLFLVSQFAAYTIWLGEWSTRQRVFALPALFALAALGWMQLRDLSSRLRTAGIDNPDLCRP